MNITDSEITIKDSLFYNFNVSKGTAILKAFQSRVAFKNVQFIANQGQTGLVQIVNESSLYMDVSLFENNGRSSNDTESVVLVKYDSNLFVTNCTFHNNKAITGGSFYFCCGTNATIEDSLFTNNEAWSGGAIFCQNHVNIVSLRNIFKGNLAIAPQDSNKMTMHNHSSLYSNLGGAITFVNDLPRSYLCEIDECVFRANNAFLKGGAIYFMFGNSYIFHSNFTWNNARKYGGAIAVEGRSKIKIINSNILKNRASMAGALSISNHVHMEMWNVLFKGNVPSKGAPSIYASKYSLVTAFYCTFSDLNFGCIQISSEYNSNWKIWSSEFLSDGIILNGILVSVSDGNILFTNCTFREVFSLFYITMNSYVSVTDSSISDIESFQGAMITLLDSYLSISNTTITNISQSTKYNTTSSIFITAFNSTLSGYGILYSKNNMSGFIKASQKTKIKITNVLIINNDVAWENSNLLNIQKSEIILDNVILENNTIIRGTGVLIMTSDSKVKWFHSSMVNNRCLFTPSVIVQAVSTNISMSDNSFDNNSCLTILLIKSDTSQPLDYTHIMNSRFLNNQGRVLYSSALSSVNIQSSEFYNPKQSIHCMLNFISVKTVRIAKTEILSKAGLSKLLCFQTNAPFLHTTKLLTFQTSFNKGYHSIESQNQNATNILEKSFYEVEAFVNLDKQETTFASCK